MVVTGLEGTNAFLLTFYHFITSSSNDIFYFYNIRQLKQSEIR